MTLSEETLKTVCANAYAYTKRPEAEQDTGARLIGIHLEGPFISMEKKGAQNPAYIRNPDVEMFLRLQEAAHGLVRLITIAPETDGARSSSAGWRIRYISRSDIPAVITRLHTAHFHRGRIM